MSRNEPLRLEKYGISRYRYRELQYFCLQYVEYDKKSWKRKLIVETLKSVIRKSYKGVRKYDLYHCLLRSVTQFRYNYDYAYMRENIPCSKAEYQKLRRLFFVDFNKKRYKKVKRRKKNERFRKKILQFRKVESMSSSFHR